MGRPQLEDTQLEAILSTGRRRAQAIKPIAEGDICEWAMLKDVGGGPVPVIGCKDNLAKTVHHGPDKSVLNNSLENLHKICTTCHNRWHTLNDSYYSSERPPSGLAYRPIEPYEPASPVEASETDVLSNEVDWDLRKSFSRISKEKRAK